MLLKEIKNEFNCSKKEYYKFIKLAKKVAKLNGCKTKSIKVEKHDNILIFYADIQGDTNYIESIQEVVNNEIRNDCIEINIGEKISDKCVGEIKCVNVIN